MLTQLKRNEFYNDEEPHAFHDAHIKAYQAQQMGIKIVFCDSRGVPVSEALAPMSSYLPHTSHNM